MIPYILTDNSLTVVLDGKAHTMNSDHPAWMAAKAALKDEDYETLKKQFDVEQAVENYFDVEADVEVKDGAVFYKEEAIHNYCVDKILSFMRNALPHKPLVKFLGKLMDNPSSRSVEELYSFLEHKNMPLTPDGNFLAYKGVTDDFKDFHTRKFDNSVGRTLEMRRNAVCDNANNGCDAGFHAGSYDYAKGYASGGGHLMVVEINPADVVSVPYDCDCQKLRTSKYKVVGIVEKIDAPAPLDDHISDEYGDYGDWDEEYSDDENDAYAEGYAQAKQDILNNLKNN